MAFIPPPAPPAPYKYVEEMNVKELANKVHDLMLTIVRFYGTMQRIENELGKQITPIPEDYLDLADAKPFPEEITPNVIMRSYRVDGTIEREYYNRKRQIEDCKEMIVKIETRLSEMPSG